MVLSLRSLAPYTLAPYSLSVRLVVVAALLLFPAVASAQSDNDDRPVSSQLRDAFSGAVELEGARLRALNQSQATGNPTNNSTILLEVGSLLHTDDVVGHDGQSGRKTFDQMELIGAYGDLVRSQLNAPSNEALLPATELFDRAHAVRLETRAVPIALALVAYSTYGERASQIRFDTKGKAILPPEGPDQNQFVGAAAMSDVLFSWNPRVVVASELIVGRSATDIAQVDLRVNDGEWTRVTLDQAMSLTPELFGRAPADSQDISIDLRIRLKERARGQNKDHTVFASTRMEWHQGRETLATTRASLRATQKKQDAPTRTVIAPKEENCPVTCYDMDQVTARFAFPDSSNIRGKLNPRIYPSRGRVELINGVRVPKLRNVVVVVDGFDAFNSRTQDDIWSDFERGLLEFLEWGFDVVVVDYDNGRDYLQRNGYALRELVTAVVPGWRDPAFSQGDIIALCGSMGTQVCRWGLRTAELGYPYGEPEDHGVGLFVAIDGPFHGANIAIGLQAIADFLKGESSKGEIFEQVLNSPAARTLMPRTRLVGAPLPKKNDNPAADWYVADPKHREHYDLVNQDWFGLPRHSRNVAVASGSGTGTFQIPGPRPGWLPTAMLNRVFKDNFIGRVNIWAQTDHDGGHIFHGHLRKFLSWRTRDLYLQDADWLDVAPGDLRYTPLQIADAWNSEDDPFGTMEAPLAFHNFSTTTSVLYSRNRSPYYVPAKDPDVATQIPFAAFHWEKCNQNHIAITDGELAFTKRELTAFRKGRVPTHPARYSEQCGVPEPVDRCLGYVDWFSNPNQPRNILPWFDGANCYVKPVPKGETGFVANNAYWAERQGGVCRVGIPESVNGRAACFLGDAPDPGRAFLWNGTFYYDGLD